MNAVIHKSHSILFGAVSLILASTSFANTTNTKPYIGIVVNDVSTQNYDGKAGVLIEGIAPDSPAARAKLQNGDIIVKFNKVRVTSRDELIAESRKTKLGELITLAILRHQVYIELKLLSSRQPNRSSPQKSLMRMGRVNEISATDISKKNYKLIESSTKHIKNQLNQIQEDIDIRSILKAMQDIRNAARDNNRTRDAWMAGEATIAIMEFKDNEGIIILYGSDNILILRVLDINGEIILNIKINDRENRDKIQEPIIKRLKSLD